MNQPALGRKQLLVAAVGSLLLTHFFFIEYRPGIHRVEVPFDLKHFHHPLADYAYQSLREGRLPQWDPSIYSGLPFAANVQAALFYPPSWILFAASWGKDRLRYQALEDFVFLHVWAAFILCFSWLRWRGLHWLAATLAAATFALGGHSMTHLQHLGMVTGHAWFPLGLWGVDEAHRKGSARPLWKTALASALCFLAGFTPLWTVFAVAIVAFAAAHAPRWRLIAQTLAALGVSILLSAIQLLPAWEASAFTLKTPRYIGHRDPFFYLSFLLPNYFNFSLDAPVSTNPGFDYYYLGAAGLVGLVAVFFFRPFRQAAPALALAGASFFFLADPFQILAPVINRPTVLSDLVRAWYFTTGLVAGLSLLIALGLDRLLRRAAARRPSPPWFPLAVTLAAALWAARLLWTWPPGGPEFSTGWSSAVDTLAASAIAALALAAFTPSRPFAAAALILLALAEFKSFGTSRRFNAAPVPRYLEFPSSPLPTVPTGVIDRMKAQPHYRAAVDHSTLFPQLLRHARLSTPQGFDPFIPIPYRDLLQPYAKPLSDREFDLNPADPALMSLLGIKWVITRDTRLSAHPEFQLLNPPGSYHHVYEWQKARPAYSWENVEGQARTVHWSPEQRYLQVASPTGGRFRLSEQFFPGWTATIDGAPTTITRCHLAFQCVEIPPGGHTLQFRYHSRYLATGAAISAFTALALLLALRLRPAHSLSRRV